MMNQHLRSQITLIERAVRRSQSAPHMHALAVRGPPPAPPPVARWGPAGTVGVAWRVRPTALRHLLLLLLDRHAILDRPGSHPTSRQHPALWYAYGSKVRIHPWPRPYKCYDTHELENEHTLAADTRLLEREARMGLRVRSHLWSALYWLLEGRACPALQTAGLSQWSECPQQCHCCLASCVPTGNALKMTETNPSCCSDTCVVYTHPGQAKEGAEWGKINAGDSNQRCQTATPRQLNCQSPRFQTLWKQHVVLL